MLVIVAIREPWSLWDAALWACVALNVVDGARGWATSRRPCDLA